MFKFKGLFGAGIVLSVGLAACGSSGSTASNSTTPSSLKSSTTTSQARYLYPLTGLTAPNEAATTRPSLEVKIDNAPQAWPQSGVDSSDVVYEEMVEGGLTRYFVVFQSSGSSVLGPIRSVRASDADLLATLGGLFAYSGGIPTFVADARATGIIDVGANSFAAGDYYRLSTRLAPHNLYSSTTALRKSAAGKGSPPPILFKYRKSGSAFSAAGAKPVTSVNVEFSGAVTAQWAWSPQIDGWTRATNGTAQVGAVSGKPISAQNVIVELMPYSNTGFVDPAGNPVPVADEVGSGQAYFFSGGKEATGTWSKAASNAVVQYTSSAGKPILLQPGRTWVEMVEIGGQVSAS